MGFVCFVFLLTVARPALARVVLIGKDVSLTFNDIEASFGIRAQFPYSVKIVLFELIMRGKSSTFLFLLLWKMDFVCMLLAWQKELSLSVFLMNQLWLKLSAGIVPVSFFGSPIRIL